MKVAVVMGSKSDLPVMQDAIDVLKNLALQQL
ncbi:Phosphoribosylcarboxyaminoimidazole (NCAIR) mutase [Capnocytophaga sputigena]|uniref:Phosphoribosylcarboxyaminoimidazole (NCAIR) mutase n=1 Tax=Capnocytophaga sputigena TaxID=1019 RepID=A0AAX2I762_CAPSP|nr:Phosphoribosylcarboxyaminoimidazole (NCAIR) mutase [Capnocytophaga sputigena]